MTPQPRIFHLIEAVSSEMEEGTRVPEKTTNLWQADKFHHTRVCQSWV